MLKRMTVRESYGPPLTAEELTGNLSEFRIA